MVRDATGGAVPRVLHVHVRGSVDGPRGAARPRRGDVPDRRRARAAASAAGGLRRLRVKNGVPIGYIEGLAFLERLEIGFNLYYTFRDGESAWIYAQVLKLHRDALGVTSFSIDPYQLGFENAEAIASGAFWFYRKLGFRPTDAGIRAAVEREERRIARTRRTGLRPATLRRLVPHNLLYEAPGSPRGEWDRFHIRNIGLAVNRRMRRDFGGSAGRLRTASPKRVSRALAMAVPRAPLERRAFAELALVLDLIPDLARWSAPEKRSRRRDRVREGGSLGARLPAAAPAPRPLAAGAHPSRDSRLTPDRRGLRAATICAITESAISSGERPPRSSPIGA